MTEYEAAVITERTQAGLAAARARGRHGGRKPKMTPAPVGEGHDAPTAIAPAMTAGHLTRYPQLMLVT